MLAVITFCAITILILALIQRIKITADMGICKICGADVIYMKDGHWYHDYPLHDKDHKPVPVHIGRRL